MGFGLIYISPSYRTATAGLPVMGYSSRLLGLFLALESVVGRTARRCTTCAHLHSLTHTHLCARFNATRTNSPTVFAGEVPSRPSENTKVVLTGSSLLVPRN